MMDLAKAIKQARPDDEWTLNGDDLTGLTWLSDTDVPTEQEIADGWSDYQKAQTDKQAADAAARDAAISHARSLGFTDEMIAVMYPNLAN